MPLVKTTASNNLVPQGRKYNVYAWTGCPLAFNRNLDIFARWKGGITTFHHNPRKYNSYAIPASPEPFTSFQWKGSIPTLHLNPRKYNSYEIPTSPEPFTSFHQPGTENGRVILRTSFAGNEGRNHAWPHSEPDNETKGSPETQSTLKGSITYDSFFSPDVSKRLVLSHSYAADPSFSQKKKASNTRLPREFQGVSFLNTPAMGVPQHCRITRLDTISYISRFSAELVFPCRTLRTDPRFLQEIEHSKPKMVLDPDMDPKMGRKRGACRQKPKDHQTVREAKALRLLNPRYASPT